MGLLSAELNRFSYIEKKCAIPVTANGKMTLKRFKESGTFSAFLQEMLRFG